MSNIFILPRPQEETRFRAAMELSLKAVHAVAAFIHGLGGRQVLMSAHIVRPTFEERGEYGDAGDIWVRRPGRGWVRVEVKHRVMEFTGFDDFPFQSIFVERANRLAKYPPAAAYFNCNTKLTHAAVVYGRTRPDWIGPTLFFDRVRGHQASAFECPIEMAEFMALARAA